MVKVFKQKFGLINDNVARNINMTSRNTRVFYSFVLSTIAKKEYCLEQNISL